MACRALTSSWTSPYLCLFHRRGTESKSLAHGQRASSRQSGDTALSYQIPALAVAHRSLSSPGPCRVSELSPALGWAVGGRAASPSVTPVPRACAGQ